MKSRVYFTAFRRVKSGVSRDDFFCEIEVFAQLTAVAETPTYPRMRSIA
jgi:hypothetical protein